MMSPPHRRFILCLPALFVPLVALVGSVRADDANTDDRPNILFAISDDQSYPYASAYDTPGIKTPAFDRVAKSGVLFMNAICASPGCSPCRAAILTGRHTWELEQAGTHASSFPRKFGVYPEILTEAGYHVGYTGKGWGPGNWKVGGWKQNPAGPAYQKRKTKSPPGMSNNDYAANFEDFLKARDDGERKPFCFWFGAYEPHRAYQRGTELDEATKALTMFVPPFLPDTTVVRTDILDYCREIEYQDQHLGRMLDLLEKRGELDNTLVIVTSDNGMPFPAAKANCYEYGIHAPLAVMWPKVTDGSRVVEDLIGFIDFAPTMLDAAGITPPKAMTGRSFLDVLKSKQSGQVDPERKASFSARERHSSSRYDNWTYPQRAVRTHTHLYIRNFKPNRWPAGDPAGFRNDRFGYYDIDGGPTKTFLYEHRDDGPFRKYFELATAKRPAEELFDIVTDPGCLNNLADNEDHQDDLLRLRTLLETELKATGDPRISGNGDVYEGYKRYSHIRTFPKPE